MALDTEMTEAWREAATRLSIRVQAPYELKLKDGTVVEVEAFLPDFGAPGGAIGVAREDEERCKRASGSSLYFSQLGAGYRSFREDLFRETLDDWGWFGSASTRPHWYTGRPWR